MGNSSNSALSFYVSIKSKIFPGFVSVTESIKSDIKLGMRHKSWIELILRVEHKPILVHGTVQLVVLINGCTRTGMGDRADRIGRGVDDFVKIN